MNNFDKVENLQEHNEFTIKEDVFLSPIEKYKLYGNIL